MSTYMLNHTREPTVSGEQVPAVLPHKMSEVPCLTPGEAVTLLSLERYKRL